MVIYKPIIIQSISIFCLTSFFLISILKKVKYLKEILLAILLLLVIVIFSTRDYTANIDLPLYMDFYTFNETFLDVFTSKTAWKGDFFFFGIMPVSHFFGLDKEEYITFQLVVSIATSFLAYYYFFKPSKSIVFLALFFMLNSSSFYLIQGNVIRQGLASSLLLLSISANNVSTTRIYKILAFFSHKGSMFIFLSKYLNFKNVYRIGVIIFAFLIGYFALFVHFLNLFPLPEFIKIKLEFYSSFQRASSNSIIKLCLLVFFNMLFLFFRNRRVNYEKAYSFFFTFSIMAFLLFRFDGIFSRLILYTDIFLPILAVGFFQNLKNNRTKVIAIITMILLSTLYSVYVFNHESILFNMGKYFSLW